ncbi:MAG: HD-GYP domain-containing protein [Pirellulales bacterium]|nr:HD-GYP domain-containing protein [Pirellulales bacterium]
MNDISIADYIPVCVSTLQAGDAAGVSLYQRDPEDNKFVLYREKDHPMGSGDLEKLRNRGIHQLYIKSSAREAYQQYLRDMLDPAIGDNSASPAARAGALNEVVRDSLELAFKDNQTDQVVANATKMGAMTADIVCNDEFAAGDLFRVMHHDYATFTHSTNVAFYTGMLAAELGYDADDVERVTTGGLLHDLGKLAIDDKILSKPARLTDEEFRIIKLHPTKGFEQLNDRTDLTHEQLMMVYQHHERLDGKGYPVGVEGDEIHPWAMICAVADVFEALTSYRPYRSPMPKSRVIELLERDSGKAFDPEILACWMKVTRACWRV